MAGRPVRRARLAAQANQAPPDDAPEAVEGQVMPGEDELQQQAVRMHLAGLPNRQIADQLGITVTESKKLIKTAIGERVGASNLPDEVRTEIARLDRMLWAIWPQVERGNFEAIDRALALSDRRERLVNPKTNDRSLRKGVDATIEACGDLENVDAALVASLRKLADRVDDAMATERGENLTKALYLMPHVINHLKEMGATPAARKALHGEAEVQVGGKLAQLRSITQKQTKGA